MRPEELRSQSKPILLKGGRLLDPANNVDGVADLLIDEGKIAGIAKSGELDSNIDAIKINVAGKLVTPGLVDIHVHLREPGEEWKETVYTGSQAAVAGGFTTVCCMPNTRPANDNAQVTEYIIDAARAANLCKVLPIGAITLGREGKSLSPMLELREAGCVAFSDDGYPVSDAGVMRRALEYGLMFNAVLTCHEEETALSRGFSMNESALSLKLGLRGMPGAAEDIMIARDIELARLTGGRVHFCHVSTGRAVTLIRRAKEDGIPVTAEVSPHHFTLDESLIGEYNTAAKMSMPLRSREDVTALLDGLNQGVIDCIASDHAPHERDSKDIEFEAASFGIIGLQTTLPLTLAKVREGRLSLPRAISALTFDAARSLNIKCGALKMGSVADITVIDLEREMKLVPEVVKSKSKNTPFIGATMRGVAVMTFVNGRQVFEIGELKGAN